jgi:hypothetical protein
LEEVDAVEDQEDEKADAIELVEGFNEDEARTNEAAEGRDSGEDLFEDVAEDRKDDGTSRQKRACTVRIINGREVQSCVTSCKRQCHKITGECRRICLGRKKRDIHFY